MKICVGAESVDDIVAWQERLRTQVEPGAQTAWHVTRMFPKRGPELLDGGSLYWTVKGFYAVRQRIVGLTQVRAEDGTKKCRIDLDPALVAVDPLQKRPFQGWRYLSAEDAPADLAAVDNDGQTLFRTLSELGIR